MDKNLNLIKEWDKVFPQSDKVSHSKVTFRNRYGITLAADMYKPKHADGKLPPTEEKRLFDPVSCLPAILRMGSFPCKSVYPVYLLP